MTIDQLLESADLDFEPRWVTKDKDGDITVFVCKPTIEPDEDYWSNVYKQKFFGPIKLAEFENKPWTECIYEVPRKEKTVNKIEKLNLLHDSALLWGKKINELVVAVNKHADIIRQIGQWGSSKGECLWCETLTKFEPKELKGAKNDK